jgi:uncharacterized cupin superfamily protein
MAIDEKRMLQLNFERPDETRPAGSGKADIINVGDMAMMRLTLPAGWKWSSELKAVANTDSCEAPHFQYHVSGRLHVKMDDGSEAEFGPGDVSVLPPGHDAWVIGDDDAVMIDVTGASVWAKPYPSA